VKPAPCPPERRHPPSPLPDRPHHPSLQVGDIICEVDGKSIKGMKPEDVAALMAGELGSYVVIKSVSGVVARIKRDISAGQKFTLSCKSIMAQTQHKSRMTWTLFSSEDWFSSLSLPLALEPKPWIQRKDESDSLVSFPQPRAPNPKP